MKQVTSGGTRQRCRKDMKSQEKEQKPVLETNGEAEENCGEAVALGDRQHYTTI